jgi:hypothetical protein
MATGSTPPTDHDDETLVADLRRVLSAADPVPEHVALAARIAIEWGALEAELAELVHDSAVDEPLLAVRGDAGPRELTFEAPDLTIEIEAEMESSEAGDSIRIVGQLVPPQAAHVAIRIGDEVVPVRADERGRFAAVRLTPGPLSLRCRLGDARVIETATLTL